ncbi:MAG: alpha/beta hydrolase [Pseudomonadota bacterium]
MTVVKANGIDVKVVEYGPQNAPALLLICGWSVQLTFWPKPFIENLVSSGYRVITYDNRDVGLSEKIRWRPPTLPFAPHIMASRVLKRKILVPYTLEDMASDAMGVLDALNIDTAHILGLSMGGMIAQIVAGKYRSRVRSATILMSSSNRFGLPTPPLDLAMDVLFSRGGGSRKKKAERSRRIWKRIRTQDGGYNDASFEQNITSTIDRAYYPPGRRRQVEAIMATGDLRRFARQICAPTLVIHGSADKLSRPHGGLDIAANIDGARFELIDGMGHDLPPNRIDMITNLITEHINDAERDERASRAAA